MVFVVPPIVAASFPKDALPKLANVVSLQTTAVHSACLSTIHSAEFQGAPVTEAWIEYLSEPSVIVIVNCPVVEE